MNKTRAAFVAATSAALLTVGMGSAQAVSGNNVGNVCASMKSPTVWTDTGQTALVSRCNNTKTWTTPGWAGHIVAFQLPLGCDATETRYGYKFTDGYKYNITSNNTEFVLYINCYI